MGKYRELILKFVEKIKMNFSELVFEEGDEKRLYKVLSFVFNCNDKQAKELLSNKRTTSNGEILLNKINGAKVTIRASTGGYVESCIAYQLPIMYKGERLLATINLKDNTGAIEGMRGLEDTVCYAGIFPNDSDIKKICDLINQPTD